MIDCRTVVKNRRRADARTQFFPKQHSSRPTAFEPSKTLKCAGRIPHRWNERDEGSQIALIAFRTSFFRRPLAVAPAAAAVASLAGSRCLRVALSSCRNFPPTAATLAQSLSERLAPLPLERWAPSPSTLVRGADIARRAIPCWYDHPCSVTQCTRYDGLDRTELGSDRKTDRFIPGFAKYESRSRGGYFVIIRLGAVLGVCSAGEITNVTQAFQPSGRFWLANSQ